jgi:hypothetical protein
VMLQSRALSSDLLQGVLIHSYFAVPAESQPRIPCRTQYGLNVLRTFGFEAWEPRRVKPVGFTISGARPARLRV